MPAAPQRILFLRPDAYGDLIIFEPVPRLIRDAWPQAEVAVLIREPYADVVPLLASEGVRWLTTTCNPYREGPGDAPAAVDALRATVRAFAPDCVVAACTEQTWLESAVAAFLPGVRQISLGRGLTDPFARAALDAVLPVDWAAIYPEIIPVEPEMPEWEKNLHLASALLGREAPRWWPLANVPDSAAAPAMQVIASNGLSTGEFVVCAAAGTANVQIKSWPAEYYGETLAWLEREQGLRALLLGHMSERAYLENVQREAQRGGGNPALWLGQDGEMPVVGGLLHAARFYFGNDTGALHLAAALGRPVVPVFGGGTWPRFQPVARRSLTVVQPLPCFGCAWDCYFVDAPCVRTITPASVRRALTQFLQDDTAGQTVFEADGLDAGARALIDTATPRLRFQREDSVARLRQTKELTALLATSETDRDARQRQVGELTVQLQTSEADRDARLRELGVSEADRDARLRELGVSEADRDARQTQIKELTALLRTSEADRDARQTQVEELGALLRTSETDRDARQTQIVELAALLETSEADRDARQTQVEELGALLRTSETDRDARQTQIVELAALLETSETDRTARGQQVAQLTSWLLAKNADCDAQNRHILELTARITELDAQVAALDHRLQVAEGGGDAFPGCPEATTAPDTRTPTDPDDPNDPDDPGPFATPPLPTAAVSGTPLPLRADVDKPRVKESHLS